MEWNRLDDPELLEQIQQESHQQPVLLFKHSTRCPVSATALHRVETRWDFAPEEVKPYLVDVIRQRNISQEIAQRFGVRHESPQALLVHEGEVIYHNSHLSIRVAELAEAIRK